MKKLTLLTLLLSTSLSASTYTTEFECGDFRVKLSNLNPYDYAPSIEEELIKKGILCNVDKESCTELIITHKESQDELILKLNNFNFDELIQFNEHEFPAKFRKEVLKKVPKKEKGKAKLKKKKATRHNTT